MKLVFERVISKKLKKKIIRPYKGLKRTSVVDWYHGG